MTVAEIFADLGFKVQGADELKEFDRLLQNVAASAQAAVAALRQLAGFKVPAPVAAAAVTPAAAATAAATAAGAAAGAAAAPPAGAPPGQRQPSAVTQGLKSLTQFPKILKQLIGFGSIIYLMKSLIGGFKNMVASSVKASFGLDKFTRQTGVTLEDMKKWEQIAAANDVKADEVFENLKALQQNAVAISLGNGGTNANRFGIDPLAAMSDPQAIFRMFQDVTKSMTQAQAMAVADSAGISERVAQMLLRERDHPTKTVSGLAQTNEQLQVVRDLGVAWNTLKVVMESVANQITYDIAPGLIRIINQVSALLAGRAQFDPYAMFRSMAQSMAVTPTAQRIVGQTNHVNVSPTINISGVTDPAAAGRAAAKYVERSFSDALYGRPQPFVMRPSPAP